MKDVFLTVNDAAKQMGISRSAIYSALARGRLKRHYRRGNLVVSERDLLDRSQHRNMGGRPRRRVRLSPEMAKRKDQ